MKTYRVKRRIALGAGQYREHDELLPEAHLWTSAPHLLHTGEVEDVHVTDDEFLEAVESFVDQYDSDLGDRILEAVGLGSVISTPEDSGIADVPGQTRAEPLLPQSLPEVSRPVSSTKVVVHRRRHRADVPGKPDETTIMATDAPPGAATGAGPVPHHRKKDSMVLNQPREGDKGVYEDQSTVDPSALNEAQTSTRPEDLEDQNVNAAYEGPAAEGGVVTGIAENPVAEPVGADLQTGGVATVPPVGSSVDPDSATPGTGELAGTDPADLDGSASSSESTADVPVTDPSEPVVGEGNAAVPAADPTPDTTTEAEPTVVDTPTDQATVAPVEDDPSTPAS